MFNLHDLYATDVVPIRCNSNTVHSFVIRFAPQVVTEVCFTVRACLENSLMRIHVKVKIQIGICIIVVYCRVMWVSE